MDIQINYLNDQPIRREESEYGRIIFEVKFDNEQEEFSKYLTLNIIDCSLFDNYILLTINSIENKITKDTLLEFFSKNKSLKLNIGNKSGEIVDVKQFVVNLLEITDDNYDYGNGCAYSHVRFKVLLAKL